MWKPVCNFPNYEVSSNGEVRSTNYNHTGVCKILKPKCCKGERRIAGDFRWRYEQEN